MNTFEPKQECLAPESREQFQLERLQALLARLRRNVRRTRDLLGDAPVESLADLRNLPITRGSDLLAAAPYGLFALPLQEVVRLHSTVGLDGQQIVVGYTRNDLNHWGRLAARQLVAAGVTARDVIQICFGGGVFEKALGYLLGAETIEAAVIPDDPFHIEYQLAMLQNYRTTVLVTSPSNAWELARLLESKRVDPQALYLRTVLLSRPVTDAEREELKRGLWADVRCTFGLPEVLDPGLTVQCHEGRFHVNEDHFITEIVDGELLVTSLCREATPLLRYATGVSAELHHDKCPCGRTGVTVRPGPRRDGRRLVNEMPVYPSQIAAVLQKTSAADLPFEADISDQRIRLSLRMTSDAFSDTMRDLVSLQSDVEHAFLTRLGIPAEIHFVAAKGPAG